MQKKKKKKFPRSIVHIYSRSMRVHVTVMFYSTATPYGQLAAFYCLKSQMHEIRVVSRRPVRVEIRVRKLDIKCIVSMCLLDRWVCNSARAHMQFICIGGGTWQKHPFIIIQSKGGGEGTAGHLTCYPNNMIKDGWLSSPMCTLLDLLYATVFFSPMHPYALRHAVWVYVCMPSVHDYFCTSVCFPS